MDLEEQYDKIYRYCYYKLNHQQKAEDITQETFLRYLDSKHYHDTGRGLHYLYTIARNLCIDEFRKSSAVSLPDDIPSENTEDRLLTVVSLKHAISKLSEKDRELLLLRYVNEVPIGVISKLMGISRFTIYRETNKIIKQLQGKLRKEDFI